MTKEEMQEEMRRYVFLKHGSQRKAAEYWGVHFTQVSNAINGRVKPTKKMLADMCLEEFKPEVQYRRKKKEAA